MSKRGTCERLGCGLRHVVTCGWLCGVLGAVLVLSGLTLRCTWLVACSQDAAVPLATSSG